MRMNTALSGVAFDPLIFLYPRNTVAFNRFDVGRLYRCIRRLAGL